MQIALDHWWSGGVPYWITEMWAGTPAWGLAPTFPVLNTLPLAALIGSEEAVRAFGIAAQVAGAWGAFVLARYLWKNRPAALVAGFVYGLHPLLVSHLALFGHQASVAVMAATPWFVLSLLEALRGKGRRWIALAGLLAGFCVLEQAEHVYGLLVLGACVVVMELANARVSGGARQVRAVLVRASGVGALALGIIAYWLLPLTRLSDSFVLTPPQLARFTLTSDVGGRLGREPALLLHRTSGLGSVVTFNTTDVFTAGGFYLSWVCVVLTLVAIVALARRRDSGTVSAILGASAVTLWMSTGGIAFVSGAIAGNGVVPWILIGVLSGLLIGGFIRHLQLGRVGLALGVVAAGLLFGVPYLAPFLGVQDFVPLLLNVRFPRLYPVALLGLALGSAYPILLLNQWLKERRPHLVPVLTPAIAVAVLAAFLVDASPYRHFYDVSPPDPTVGYGRAASVLAATGDSSRVASSIDPRVVEPLLNSGRDQSTGWPHPVASQDIWHLTFESLYASPPGFRDAALGLSSTGYYVLDPGVDPIKGTGLNAPKAIDEVSVQRNPKVLPVVRAYDSVVVVNDKQLAPDLAVALSQRGIAVVVGGDKTSATLAEVARARVRATSACSSPRADQPRQDAPDEILSSEVASACALHNWVGGIIKIGTVGLGSGTGAAFTDARGDLRGITLWLDRSPGPAELVVRELGPDGRSLGKIVSRARSNTLDENEMSYFPLERGVTAPGKRYVFLLSCVECPPGTEPRLTQSTATRGGGDMVVNGELRRDRVASFGLVYERVAAVDVPATTVQATRTGPGRWSVSSHGTKPSLVVVGEAWFPGWQAHVDGKPAPALKADGAFVGVPVPAGDHRITLSYEAPDVALLGKVISSAAVLLAIAMLLPWHSWRRRRHRRKGETGPGSAGRAEASLVPS